MATSRIEQIHIKRVEQIAEEAAAKIAADSPFEEDVIVTIEEVPPTTNRPADEVATVPAPRFDPRYATDAIHRDAGCAGRGECGVCPRDLRCADEIRRETRGGRLTPHSVRSTRGRACGEDPRRRIHQLRRVHE